MKRLFLSLTFMLGACAEGSAVPNGGSSSTGGGGAGAGGPVWTTGGGGEGGTPSFGGAQAGGAPEGAGPGNGGAPQGGAPMGGTSGGCPPGEFATGVDGGGALTCAKFDAQAALAINGACSTYLGWRDGCEGCGAPPTKWGKAGGVSCAVGPGANNTCITANLGGSAVALFGVDMDGGVDQNDMFYAGFTCEPLDGTAGPCAAGDVMTGFSDGTPVCVSAGAQAVAFATNQCKIFLGWRDGCDGCAAPPGKWGSTSVTSCNAGAGSGNFCAPSGGVQWVGVDLDGDVDGNDKVYLGMVCAATAPDISMAVDSCPAGQIVTNIENGLLTCKSPGPALASYMANHCTLYMGWKDNCNGCGAPPQKWGAVRTGYCANGGGGDNTCSPAVLGADSVSLFGLSFDGDVNDDDTLQIGFKCE